MINNQGGWERVYVKEIRGIRTTCIEVAMPFLQKSLVKMRSPSAERQIRTVLNPGFLVSTREKVNHAVAQDIQGLLWTQ